MFIEALVIIFNKRKQPRCFQKVNEETNYGTSVNRVFFSNIKNTANKLCKDMEEPKWLLLI